MVSSNHMKLLSKTMQGICSNDVNEVKESEEFDSKHYFVRSFCFTGVSGSCVVPSLRRLASHLIPVRAMKTPETVMKHFQFYNNN